MDRRELGRRLDGFAHTVNDDVLADRALRAKQLRRFSLTPNADGGWTAAGQLEPVAGATLARPAGPARPPHGPDDDRSQQPQRMADALATVTTLAAGNPRCAPPTPPATGDGDDGGAMDRAAAHRVARAMAATRAQVLVITTVDALHGVPGAAPAEVDGYGAVCTATARQICCDAQVTTVVTAADGDVLRVGRARRTPTTRQRIAVIVRDRRCVGCHAPAIRCQVHHVHWWRAGRPPTWTTSPCCAGRATPTSTTAAPTVTRQPDGRYTTHHWAASRPPAAAAAAPAGRHTP